MRQYPTYVIGIVALFYVASAWAEQAAHPTVFPWVRLEPEELRRLSGGDVIVKTLESNADSDLVVFAGTRVDVTPQRFLDAVTHGARLWQGSKVPRTGTFGSQVRADDVMAMRLPPEDVDALRRCRPGDCEIKLSDREIARLRRVIEENPAGWRSAAQDEFRSLIIERIQAYRRAGLSALAPVHDHEQPIQPDAFFTALVSRARVAGAPNDIMRRLVEYLHRYPHVPLPDGARDHLYWLELRHPPKPTIQATHAVIHRAHSDAVQVVVVSRQIFATHYVNASLSATALVQVNTGQRVMLYINRTTVDGLGGFFSGVTRYFVERRLRNGAREALQHLKQRIETGHADDRPRL